MTAANFVDTIGSRNLFMPDSSLYTTPGTLTLPNGDLCTRILSNAAAYYADPTRFFAQPWSVSNWSLEFWCHPGTGMSASTNCYWQIALANDSLGGSEWGLSFGLPITQVNFDVYNNGGTSIANVSTNILGNAWQHIVIICDCATWISSGLSNKTVTYYRNGTLLTSHTVFNIAPTRAVTSPNPRLWLVGGPSASFSNVNIGKIAIYNRALTPTEISDHYLAMTVV